MSYENIEKLAQPAIYDLYESLSPRHRRIIDWTIKEYADIEAKSDERISTEIWKMDAPMGRPITGFAQSPVIYNVKRRRLENLNIVDFDFGLEFINDNYMPFFTSNDIALFKEPIDDIEAGDMCLVKDKYLNNWYLAFKETNGFFELDGSFLDEGDAINVVGVLVNIESK